MKFVLRQLAKSPGFTVIALVTLALGIGLNTTAFTILNRVLLQSLPFKDPSTLVQVWSSTPRNGRAATSPADYFDEKEQNTVFSDIAAYQQQRTSYAEPGRLPIQVAVVYMTANYFPVLGVRPELGRAPTEDESEKMARVCLISDAFWNQHFNADPTVIGRTARINGRPSTIIGVVPPSFDDPALFGLSSLFRLTYRPEFFYLDPTTQNRSVRWRGWEQVVARLKPGVSLRQAQAGMDVLAERLAHEYPDSNKDRRLEVVPYPASQIDAQGAQLTWTTAALSGLILLIACINLANLQIVRTTARRQEVAVRLALGCSPRRIVGLFLLESVLVSLVGGALGMVTAVWSNAYVARFLGIDMPIQGRVIAFTLVISLVTALLFGTVPPWLATRSNVGEALKSGNRGSTSGRSRHWLRQGLVLVELALALTLLAGAGFFIGGLRRLTHRTLGWEAANQVIGVVELDRDHYGGERNGAKLLAFGDQVIAAMRALPGVTQAALADSSPSWGDHLAAYHIDGQPPPERGREPLATYYSVTPGWFDVFGIRLVEGRGFAASDNQASRPVAIINESMEHALWPGESALGKRLGDAANNRLVWVEVVGVVRDFKGGAADFFDRYRTQDRLIRPWAQNADSGYEIVFLKTAGPPGPLKEPLRKTLGALLPDVAPFSLATIDEDMANGVAYFTFLRRILVQIGILGLLLSAVGVYGVVANLAAERTKEVGIRMALGARPGSILWLFVRNGVILACAGAALGMVGALALTRILGGILPYLPGNDPRFVAAAAAVLITVSLVACWIPARRTTKVDPMVALRVE